jgi:hypothetical protein
MDTGRRHQVLLVFPSRLQRGTFRNEGPASANDAHLVQYDVHVFTLLVEELAVEQRFVLQGWLPAQAQNSPESFHHGYLLPGCDSPASDTAGLAAVGWCCTVAAAAAANGGLAGPWGGGSASHFGSFGWVNGGLFPELGMTIRAN